MEDQKKLDLFKIREIKIDDSLLEQTKGGNAHIYDTEWQTKDPHSPTGWASDRKLDKVPLV